MLNQNRWPFQVLLFLGLLGLVWALGDSRTLLFFSGLTAFLCHPLLLKLQKRGIPRPVGTAILFLAIASPTVILLLVIIPFLAQNLSAFIHEFPDWAALALQKIEAVTQQYGVNVPVNREEVLSLLTDKIQLLSLDHLSSVTEILRRSALSLSGAILMLLNLVLAPVFFIYLLVDFEKWQIRCANLIPLQARPVTRRLGHRANLIVGHYLRGQLGACLILGSLYGTGLQLIGVPFGWLIGFMTGFFSFMPYIGFSVGFTVALITALASGQSGLTVGLVVIVMGLIQAVESFLVIPKLVGKYVGLSPVEALVSLIICGNLFGFGGLLLAIPVGALFKEVFAELRQLAGV